MSAYLWGWVDTDHPGYRSLILGGTGTSGGTTRTVASGYYRWPEFIAALSSALSASSWAASLGADGVVTLSGTSTRVRFPDRLGWLLGLDAEAGDTMGTGARTSVVSQLPPPGGVALLGAVIESLDVTRETALTLDRSRRAHGYVHGELALYRLRCVMTADTVDSVRAGWLTRGRVTVSWYPAATYAAEGAWDAATNPAGYVDGDVVALESFDWLDGLQETAEVSLVLAVTTPGV